MARRSPAAKPRPRRRRVRLVPFLTKAFVWVILAIFLFTSLGVAIIAFHW